MESFLNCLFLKLTMVTVYDVDANKLISKSAEELKKLINAPVWTTYVKTGAGKERPPDEPGWYYKRVASILRKVYLFGPIGVNKLRVKYGDKRNVGTRGERVYKGSGKIIRTALQQLEKLELIKKIEKGEHKGKIITNKGKSFLDKIAKQLK